MVITWKKVKKQKKRRIQKKPDFITINEIR
jgi:hypothetical protein